MKPDNRPMKYTLPFRFSQRPSNKAFDVVTHVCTPGGKYAYRRESAVEKLAYGLRAIAEWHEDGFRLNR